MKRELNLFILLIFITAAFGLLWVNTHIESGATNCNGEGFVPNISRPAGIYNDCLGIPVERLNGHNINRTAVNGVLGAVAALSVISYVVLQRKKNQIPLTSKPTKRPNSKRQK